MQEKTLVKPLSGSEVKHAILFKIGEQLDRDCTLANHNAYASFCFSAEINVTFQGAKTNQTTVGVFGENGAQDPFLETFEEKISVVTEPEPPNQVRADCDLGIPVVTTDPVTGYPVEKRVKYTPSITKKGK